MLAIARALVQHTRVLLLDERPKASRR